MDERAHPRWSMDRASMRSPTTPLTTLPSLGCALSEGVIYGVGFRGHGVGCGVRGSGFMMWGVECGCRLQGEWCAV